MPLSFTGPYTQAEFHLCCSGWTRKQSWLPSPKTEAQNQENVFSAVYIYNPVLQTTILEH